jgi:hypothetical protein
MSTFFDNDLYFLLTTYLVAGIFHSVFDLIYIYKHWGDNE